MDSIIRHRASGRTALAAQRPASAARRWDGTAHPKLERIIAHSDAENGSDSGESAARGVGRLNVYSLRDFAPTSVSILVNTMSNAGMIEKGQITTPDKIVRAKRDINAPIFVGLSGVDVIML